MGGGSDIDASQFSLTGEGGQTYQLTDTADVERTSSTQFTLILSATDRAAVNQIFNKNGSAATAGTSFNLAAGDDWNTQVTAGDTSDATNPVTVSNVAVPVVTSAAYDASTGTLVVTGTGLLKRDGAANDIDVTKLTLTGEGGSSHTLTSGGVEITSGTQFSVTLNSADRAAVGQLLNKQGTASSSGTTYNLAAAEDWAAGADASVVVADLTGNSITVSNLPTPTITSATYSAKSGVLVITGNNFVQKAGATNDIDLTKLTLLGQGGATRTLTSTNVEITSATEFSITLNGADKAAVDALLDKAGTAASDNTTYNLSAAEDWAAGADPAVNVADIAGNAITVSLNTAPTSADTTESVSYNGSYTFQAADFAFNDSDGGDSLQGITIKTLPVDGDLYLNNVAITATDTAVSLADLNGGMLTFKPDAGGSGNGYAGFTFTVNDGTDSSVTPNTVTLNVAAPPPAPTPSPTPDNQDTVDGVTVTQDSDLEKDDNNNILVVTTTEIPLVTDDRSEDSSTENQTLADIPLAESDDGTVLLQLALPVGVQASAEEVGGLSGLRETLIASVQREQVSQEELSRATDGIDDFVATVSDEQQVTVRTIDLQVAGGSSAPASILISGASGTGEDDQANPERQEALVINARALPAGTVLQLDQVEFAVILGDVRVIGGEGRNLVYGDSDDQFIVLGAEDDELHGNAGDDTIASHGGNDRLFGGADNDRVIGGEGDDYLDGGEGDDTLNGGQSDAGAWRFVLTDEGVRIGYQASDAAIAGVQQSNWLWQTDGTAWTVDDRLAFTASEGAALETLTLLYHGVFGRLPEVEVLNSLAKLGLSETELAALAYQAYQGRANDASLSLEARVTAAFNNFWGEGQATAQEVDDGVAYFSNGGNWGEAMLYLSREARHRDDLLDNDGGLQLAQVYNLNETGWSSDLGNDTLLGGAGDDTLIGGRGSDLLDGGAGNDQALQVLNRDDYSLFVTDEGLLQLRSGISGQDERDTLVRLETLVFGDQSVDVSGSNLSTEVLLNSVALYRLMTGAGPDLEDLNEIYSGQLSLEQLATVLMQEDAYQNQLGGLDNRSFVGEIADRVLDVALNTDVLENYAGQLDDGSLSRTDVILVGLSVPGYQDSLIGDDGYQIG